MKEENIEFLTRTLNQVRDIVREAHIAILWSSQMAVHYLGQERTKHETSGSLETWEKRKLLTPRFSDSLDCMVTTNFTTDTVVSVNASSCDSECPPRVSLNLSEADTSGENSITFIGADERYLEPSESLQSQCNQGLPGNVPANPDQWLKGEMWEIVNTDDRKYVVGNMAVLAIYSILDPSQEGINEDERKELRGLIEHSSAMQELKQVRNCIAHRGEKAIKSKKDYGDCYGFQKDGPSPVLRLENDDPIKITHEHLNSLFLHLQETVNSYSNQAGDT